MPIKIGGLRGRTKSSLLGARKSGVDSGDQTVRQTPNSLAGQAMSGPPLHLSHG